MTSPSCNACMVERRLCIAESDAYRRIVDGTLLPAVMDEILVDNREFFIHHVHSTPPLILIVLIEAYSQRRRCCPWKGGGVLLTHLSFTY